LRPASHILLVCCPTPLQCPVSRGCHLARYETQRECSWRVQPTIHMRAHKAPPSRKSRLQSSTPLMQTRITPPPNILPSFASVAPNFARKGGRRSPVLLACKSKRWNTPCHCCQVDLGCHACVTPLLILPQNIAPVDWATEVRFARVSRASLGGGADPAFFPQVL